MASRKALLGLLISLSCLWVAKALEGNAKVSVEVKDASTQQGTCNDDSMCRAQCPAGCAITQCIFQQCVCGQCKPLQPNSLVRGEIINEEMKDAMPQSARGGQPCNDDEICLKNCEDCKYAQCVLKQCVCIKCYLHPTLA
ncbi:hypothetical protein AALP_AA8G457600 [Arabis alpina]|uniref:Uncharacterized protein n=1 Tax=Arabis alpina TaxID=50452 RepID=A0A087GDP0_ARAAL|nr:hypothetical protein AALP_AA8G457600 [Arabis alpina]